MRTASRGRCAQGQRSRRGPGHRRNGAARRGSVRAPLRLPAPASVAVLGGLSPWLFEISRLVFEVALEPLLLSLFLFVVFRASSRTWRTRHSVAIGLLLGAIAYTYQAGRVLAPAFALGLALCFHRG